MYREITSKDLLVSDLIRQYIVTGSTKREETETEEILGILNFQRWQRRPIFTQSLNTLFKIDISSVNPYFEPTTATSFTVDSLSYVTHVDIITPDILEHDICVKMLPKKKYTIKLNIRNIKRAELNFVGPE
ncbi:hypothetical protein JW824_10875 [bacterium]|nr:hypothetical protein [bacterium]